LLNVCREILPKLMGGVEDGGKLEKNGRSKGSEIQAYIIDGASVFWPQTTTKTNAIARRISGGKPTDGND
ncbi:Hypothetical predicted protein, partial [Olea europaea subsp. europaea]